MREPRAPAVTAGLIARGVVYLVLVLAFSALLVNERVQRDLLAPLNETLAGSAAVGLSLMGLEATSRGADIAFGGRLLTVVGQCTGIDAAFLLVAAMLCFPAPWIARIAGMAIAIVLMAVLNWVRIVTLCLLASHSLAWLEIGHFYVWPVGIILVAVATFLVWAERVAVPAR